MSFKKLINLFKKPKTEKIDDDNWLKSYHKKNIMNLTKRQAMTLEIEALQRLQKNYVCTCNCGNINRHFPIIKNINWSNLTIIVTDCGDTIYSIIEKVGHRLSPDMFIMFGEQVRCIVDNLNKNNIKHLDLHRNNICIKNGVICLIDFDIIVLDNNGINEEIRRRSKVNKDINKEIKKLIIC